MEFFPSTSTVLRLFAVARMIAPTFRRLVTACGIAGLLTVAHAQSVRYREELAIEWGPVAFTDGTSVTKETWFVRQAPTFAVGCRSRK